MAVRRVALRVARLFHVAGDGKQTVGGRSQSVGDRASGLIHQCNYKLLGVGWSRIPMAVCCT